MAKQIRTDGEFTLQRQARRRLIGAIALMLAVVIFLPLIFDADPAATVTRDIELHIPDAVATAPVQMAAAGAQQKVESAAATVAPAIAESIVPATVAPPAQPPAVTKPSANPAAVVPPKPSSKPSGWVVQVGAYSREDAAKQMVANLKQRGYPAYTEQADLMLRVRVGNYPSKEAAEKIRLKLEAIGLHPNVLNLE
ncbi:MAG: SPOR domain-containing protein [Sideroxyarcus sp.]|nr:SPOR domain-containing protein [Sideroxyarcus sp.]